MKNKMRIISILLVLILFAQITAFGAFEESLEAYWGQDFPDDEWAFGVGEAVFWQRADISNYEFTLYKNNEEVYKNRIEEGSWGDETDWDWVPESIFLPKFCEYGTGTYYFKVSSLTDTGIHIDDETVVETVSSGNFEYVKPSAKLSVPQVISNQNGKIDWEKTDQDTYGYIFDLEVDYGDGIIYDPDYEETYCLDEFQSEYDVEDIISALEYIDKNYNGKYPIEKAQIKIRVRAMPEDITQYNPSDYTQWYTIDYQYEGGGTTDQEEPLDRTVVDQKYYKAAKAVYDLGLMKDVYKNHSENVTRGYASEVLIKAMGYEDMAEASKDSAYYTDVEVGSYLNGCVNVMRMLGIVSGTTYSTFSPDTELAYQDVAMLFVKALGYDPVVSGGYPYGYLSTAMSYGMLKDVTYGIDATVTKEEFAQILYNCINIGLLKQTSYGTVNSYATSDETLFIKYMQKIKFIGDVEFIDQKSAKLSGFVYDKTTPGGLRVKDKLVTITDTDILTYERKTMELYMDDNSVLCGFEFVGTVISANNGQAKAQSRVIPIEIQSYGDKYTKYKINNEEEYKAIPEKPIEYLLKINNGMQRIKIYLANEDLTETTSKTVNINYDNYHTVTFVVDGEIHSTKKVGCGSAVTAPTVSPYNRTFNGWLNKPESMPDMDITVYGTTTPNISYSGKIVKDGQPVYATIYVGQNWKGVSNSTSGEFSFSNPKGEGIMRIVFNNETKTICLNGMQDEVDLGTIDIGNINATVITSAGDIVSAEFEDAVLTQEDLEYKEKEGNDVSVKLNFDTVYPSQQSSSIKNALANRYSEYEAINYYNISLLKEKTGAETSSVDIKETDEPVMIKLKISTNKSGMDEYAVLREHEGEVDMLTTTPNEEGEYVQFSDDMVTIYANKFSQYSVIARNYAVYSAQIEWNEFKTANINVTTPKNPVANAVLYVACYDEYNTLLKVDVLTEFEASNSFSVADHTRKIRAFMWDGLRPLF